MSIKVFILLLLSLNCNLIAQVEAPTYDRIVEEYFTNTAPGAAILVKRNGATVFEKSIGIKNLDSNQRIESDDIFRIASITKQFTAAAILKLVEQGKLSLDDSISKYINGLDNEQSPILIKHLLSHTAGVKNYTELKDWDSKTAIPNISSSAIVDIFKNEPLDFEPGAQYKYSNSGYFMLGYIVEVASGQSYADFLEEHFFKPLNMASTGYEDQTNPMIRRIKGYSQRGENFISAEDLDMNLAFAAGGLVSTTEDLWKWNEAIFSKKVLSESSLSLAHTKFKLNDGSEVPYGFGWELGEIKGLKTIKHDGIINGFISFALYLPENDVFVSVLTNCDCTQYIEEVTSKLAALAVGDPYSVNQISKNKSDLLKYQGTYQSELGGQQTIGYQDGQLFIYQKGGSKYPLTCVGEDEFLLESTLASFYFESKNEKYVSFLKQGFDNKEKWFKISGEVMPLESIEIKRDEFEKYIGKYQVKGAFVFDVYAEGDKMYGSVQGDRKELHAYDTDKFFAIHSDIKLEFVKDKSGVVSQVILVLPIEMKGDRI